MFPIVRFERFLDCWIFLLLFKLFWNCRVWLFILSISHVNFFSIYYDHNFFSRTFYAISAYQHYSCEFEIHSWRGVLDTTLSDKVCQWYGTCQLLSLGVPVPITNKTDPHDQTEILLNVALNTMPPNEYMKCSVIVYNYTSPAIFHLRSFVNIYIFWFYILSH